MFSILMELIHTKSKQKDLNTEFNHKQDSIDAMNDTSIGKGAFSKVTNQPDPFMFSKSDRLAKPRFDNSKPAYQQWVEYLISNKTYEHNPVVPKIYKVKKTVDINGSFKYSYTLERLFSVLDSNITIESLATCLKKLFNDNYHKQQVENWVESKNGVYGDEYSDDRIKREMMKIFISEFVDFIKYGNESFKDEHLDEIKKILNLLTKHNVTKLDLNNINNFMFRLTPVGLQLVITDPIN